MDSRLNKRLCTRFALFWLYAHAIVLGVSHSESMGILSVEIPQGSIDAPSYTIFSPGVKASSIFRGPVKSSQENNVTFYKTPDISNPANQTGPLSNGVLNSSPAQAIAILDENGSVSSINLTFAGAGYLGKPNVIIPAPAGTNPNASTFRPAIAVAEWNSTLNQISHITVLAKGRGYDQPPQVTIEGGPHYLKIIDPDSNHTGLYFPIISNTDHVVELNNSNDIDNSDGVPTVSEIFSSDLLVEVVRGWTLRSLFGVNTDDLSLNSDSDPSNADWVYLLKAPQHQLKDASDYVPHFHDGTEWKLVHTPEEVSTDHFIHPDESVIIARRADSNLTLSINGSAPQAATSWYLPEFNRSKLVGNPFPTELKLSDIIGKDFITKQADENSTTLWLANKNQEEADNIQILNASGWATYWHDGSNLEVTQEAEISARPGSGLGGALTVNDFSWESGIISNITNPVYGNVVVTTSESHGLGNGFWVRISSAFGLLTNENKDQINSNGEVVPAGEGLQIESPVNGKWEITNATDNTFELKNCSNYADFIGSANWSTGNPGQGYDKNVSISILGGGGFGARALAIVDINGSISSVSITHGGLFYTHAPAIVVHPGGWKNLGKGNAPINNLIIPPGSGALLIRNNPIGRRSRIPLQSIQSE